MRWAAVIVLFLILASAPALATFGPFTANVTEVVAGEPVFIEGSWSTSEGSLEIRKNTTSGGDPARVATITCSQSTTSNCEINYTDEPIVTTTYSLQHNLPYDVMLPEDWITVRVVDPAPVIVDFIYAEDGAISVPFNIEIDVRDNSLVRSYSLDFGNGDVLTFDCNAARCQKNIDNHRYESPGSYRITLTAIDDADQPTTQTSSLVEISGGLDSDEDGILDEEDECPDTNAAFIGSVATSGNPTFIGCSCDEIDSSDFDEPNACTVESCIINSTGGLEILHTPVEDGTSPGNLQGTCIDGQYVAGECGADPVVCFGNLGNEHPFCFDGSTFYEQVDTCGSGEVCAVNADGDALCVEGVACLSSPGCRVGIAPSNAVVVDGTCDTGRTCFSCVDGFEWTGTSCEESLDCSTYHYLDADGDGQGAGSAQCIEFRDSVTDNRDCNDNNPDAYVGAVELCNDVDNDCDGDIGLEDSFCVDVVYDHCAKEDEVETVWVRDDQLTCVEFEKTKTTSFTAVSPECEYVETEELTPKQKSRNLADGTSCPVGFCNDGQCVPTCEHQCLSEKPANSLEVTAQSCSGTNSCYKCANNMIWDGNKCVNTGYQIVNVNSMTVEDQKTYTLDPVLQTDEGDKKSAVFTYKGLINRKTSSSLTLLADGVGTKTLTITASRLQGTQEIVAATTTIEITTVCSSESQCCIEGTTNYQPDGTSCGAGVCQGGTCEIACTPSFENSPRTCSDGIDNSCNGIVDCQEIDGEINNGCRPFCQAFCPQGEAACGNQCFNLQESHNNCGACGVSCSSSEICQGGQCIDQGDQCFVACSSDNDCDGTCQLAGTCEAFCEDTGVLELQEEEQTALLSDVIRQRTFAINKTIINDELTIVATNLVGTTLNNFTMLISFPQEFQFTRSNYPYEQLNERTIRVKTNLEGKQRFEYDLTTTGNPERIIIETTHDSVDPTTAKKLSNDELTIRSNFEETENATKISLKLTPGANLKDLRVPLEIPKCLAEHVDEIQFDQSNYEVINVDPLMVWTFDALNSEQEISFTVPKLVDQNCKDQMRAFGVAQSEPVNPWLPIAIIPIIGLTLVFFQRFHKNTEHLGKKEFYKLAKEQGQSEGDIERSWAEYKRRF